MQIAKALETAPFPGPRPFKEEESRIFFGRERETSELISLIAAHPIVLLYAPSGAGKTSLVNAGLIPKLKGQKAGDSGTTDKDAYEVVEEFDVLKPMRVQGEFSSQSKLAPETNIYMLNALLSGADASDDTSKLPRMTLAQVLAGKEHRVNQYGEPLQRVIIFDQFEELFTAYPEHWERRKDFFQQVSNALVGNVKKEISGDPMLRVVFSMREDYIAELDPYTGLLPGCLRTRFRLEQMKEKAAMTAVEVPFRNRNISLASNVARDLVKNLLRIPCKGEVSGPKFGQYIDPVQLQIVCQSLWESLKSGENKITQDHLKTYGDLSQVLSDFYEKGVRKAAEKTGESEANLRMWFENTLIVDGNRAPVTQGKDKAGGMPNHVVDLLEKKNLLKKEWRGSGTILYELAHDHFIEPIRWSNEKWRVKQGMEAQTLHHLDTQALKWEQGSGALLHEEELVAADLLMHGPIKPSPLLEKYVKASHAVAQQKRYRVYKLGFAVLLVGVVLLSVAVVIAYRNRNEAFAQRDEAEKQAKAADKNYQKEQQLKIDYVEKSRYADERSHFAEQQRLLAVDESRKARGALVEAQHAKQQAEKLQKLAEAHTRTLKEQQIQIEKYAARANSRLLAITARSYLDDDPELSVLLAQKASDEFGDTRAAEDVMRAGLASLSTENHVLQKHNRRVNYAELSPDQTRVVTASDDWNARLWKLDTKKGVDLPHKGAVVRAAFSPDGQMVVTASLDGTARVWDGSKGALIRELKGHQGALSRAVWSPNSKYIATASDDHTIKIWNARTGAEVTTLRGHSNAVQDLAWSPDGNHIASEAFDGTGRIWHLKGDEPVLDGDPIVLRGLTGSASAIAFSADSKMLVTESGQAQATVWDVVKGKKKFSVGTTQLAAGSQHQRATITSVAFSPDNNLFITTSSDGIARVYTTSGDEVVSELRGHTRSIYAAQFSGDSKWTVTASADNTARLWNAVTGQILLVLKGHSGGVKSASFSQVKRDVIVTGSDDGTARVWNISSSQHLLPQLPVQSAAVSSAAFSPRFRFEPAVESEAGFNADVATTGYDGTLRIWNARTGESRTTSAPYGHYARISYAAFSPDGRYLVTTSFDKTAKVWMVDSDPLKELSELRGHQERVIKAVFSPDSKFVVTASLDKTARVWETQTGRELLKLGKDCAPSVVYSVDYSPDGNSIITAGSDRVVRVFDGRTFQLKGEGVTNHDKDIYGVRFSPGGEWIVTASADGTARVWDARNFQQVAELKRPTPVGDLQGHTDEVNSAVFSPNGKFIVTSSNDKTARVWDTTTWTVINVLRGQKGKVFTAAFSPDSRYIVTASDDGTAHIYPPEMFAITFKDLLVLIKGRVAERSLSQEEWERFKYDTLLEP